MRGSVRGYPVPEVADPINTRFRRLYEVLMVSARQFGFERVSRMGAALSYRTFFAAAPLLFFAVAIFGQVLGSESEAKETIITAVEDLAGEEVAEAVALILQNVQDSSGTAAIIGAILLLWTASTLFMELQNNLNDIFGVPYEHTAGLVAFIRKRGIGFLWVLGLGFGLIALWLVNFAWSFFEGLFLDLDLEAIYNLVSFLAPLVSLIVFPLLIALIFRSMIMTRVPWKALWYGALFTAITSLIATYVMGRYFEYDENSSATFVVGSVFVILLLAYVLANVFLFGAIVTRVYADFLQFGDVVQPAERENLLLDSGPEPDPVEVEKAQRASTAALYGFLGGLFVGWRRSGK